ncbi:nitroreductase family deazaflavin-dependent oxidoreductase [soil metagenome]
MGDDTPAVIRNARKTFIAEHRKSYLRSGGAEGHIGDLTTDGGHSFTTHCLIKYTGRKSGKTFITPLIYGNIGGEVVIVASKGGADNHPAWYLNIAEQPEVEFQVATQAFRGTWREPQGEERAKIWAFIIDIYPPYISYQAATDREIPLVMMKVVEPIPIFREEDATGIRPI